MAHLLLIEVPGGNDFDILEVAHAQGHQVSFFTADKNHYVQNGTLTAYLQKVERIVEITHFDYEVLEKSVLEIHQKQPFEAILCLIDIRIVEASQLAERLQLPFVNSKTALMMRDKFTVRTALSNHGITQPEFYLATDNQTLRTIIEDMGFPVLVKPSDGYGSQNIAIFLDENDLNPLLDPLDDYLPCLTDYGFGVKANDRLLVERYISGQLIGCDTFTQKGVHTMLGINEKLMYPPPSCAIKGSCFPIRHDDIQQIETYVFSILDALNFNEGATHTEILITPDHQLLLVEVNPRLVGAKIPRLVNLALNRSIHNELINLHLGKPLSFANINTQAHRFAVSRWITTQIDGTLTELTLPPRNDANIHHVEVLKKIGDSVSYPYQNADRIGYIMTVGNTRESAEQLADNFIAQVKITVSNEQ